MPVAIHPQTAHGKLLIVDDDPVHTTLLEKVLLREGYQLAFAGSGEEALSVARDNPPELVLLDVKLPGMDGFATCQELVKVEGCRDVSVIFVSGSERPEDKIQGLKLGAMDFMTKPFDLKELTARIEGVLKRGREARRKNRRLSEIRTELSEARKVQQDLLPQTPPIIPGLEVYGRMQPAREVSGDYFDFIERPNGLGICIGDVSGKGVPACLVMVMARLLLRHWQWSIPEPTEALLTANEILHANTDPYQFMSMVLLSWEPEKRRMLLAGAGHENMLIYRAATEQIETVQCGGVVLGLRKSIRGIIRQRELPLAVGDTVLLYTDGLTEGANPAGEMFGVMRLMDAFAKVSGKSCREVADGMMESFTEFGDGEPLHDDTTVVVVRRTD